MIRYSCPLLLDVNAVASKDRADKSHADFNGDYSRNEGARASGSLQV
jgi:hypothetical protein